MSVSTFRPSRSAIAAASAKGILLRPPDSSASTGTILGRRPASPARKCSINSGVMTFSTSRNALDQSPDFAARYSSCISKPLSSLFRMTAGKSPHGARSAFMILSPPCFIQCTGDRSFHSNQKKSPGQARGLFQLLALRPQRANLQQHRHRAGPSIL